MSSEVCRGSAGVYMCLLRSARDCKVLLRSGGVC